MTTDKEQEHDQAMQRMGLQKQSPAQAPDNESDKDQTSQPAKHQLTPREQVELRKLNMELSKLNFFQSQEVGDLFTALAKAQANFTPITKSHENPFYGSKYADLNDCYKATMPALNAQGIAVTGRVTTGVREAGVTITLHYGNQFYGATGHFPATKEMKDGRLKYDAQTLSGAATYGRRVVYSALVSLAADEDDDGNSVADETDDKRQPQSYADRKKERAFDKGKSRMEEALKKNTAPAPAPSEDQPAPQDEDSLLQNVRDALKKNGVPESYVVQKMILKKTLPSGAKDLSGVNDDILAKLLNAVPQLVESFKQEQDDAQSQG